MSGSLSYVAYYRVSTKSQGASGLGFEAQQEAVRQFVAAASGELIAEYNEVASGRSKRRPQFDKALHCCRLHGATLIVARLDRLSRDASLISRVLESETEVLIADFPGADRLTMHVLAAVAEYEWTLISERIKEALAAANKRGSKQGPGRIPTPEQSRAALAVGRAVRLAKAKARACDLGPTVLPMVCRGVAAAGIAEELNLLGVPSARGGRWHASSAALILKRIKAECVLSPEAKAAIALGPVRLRKKLRVAAAQTMAAP